MRLGLNPEDIEKIIAPELPDCEIGIEGGNGKFHISVVGEVFDGLNPVRRQQMIYKLLNSQIESGAIHAVTMQLHTFAESSS